MSRNTTKNRVYPIVLKSIINDAHRDNKSFALNDKQIRSRLRAKFADAHIKNTSWIATSSREYDAIRCAFDVQYANRVASSRKRNAKKNDATSNVETTNA